MQAHAKKQKQKQAVNRGVEGADDGKMNFSFFWQKLETELTQHKIKTNLACAQPLLALLV